MQFNDLKPKTKKLAKRRVGRGGKRGKTSGRGHKGQKQHGGHGIRPELRDFIKKLPKRRGFGKNRARTVNSSRTVYVPINLDVLEKSFKDGDVISPKTLLDSGLLSKNGGKIRAVKILARGKLTKKLAIENCLLSDNAKKTIKKAGGEINYV